LNTFIKRYSRDLGIIGVVGMTLLLGSFDLVLAALRGPRFDELHTPLGQFISLVASQFAPAPSLTRAGSDRYALIAILYLGATVLRTLLFALLAGRIMRPGAQRSAAAVQLLLAAQLLLGLCGAPDLLFVLSVELALVLPLRRGLAWLLLQMLAYVVIQLLIAYSTVIFSDSQMRLRLLYLGMEVIVHSIVFGVVHLATRERRGRRTLTAAHAELLATQSLLGDMVRDSERLRIARDLHDSVGHHLTALKLHLDLAVRQSNEPVLASLRTSSELAGALLAEVRTVVSTERRPQRIDLRHALTTLCAGIPTPQVALLMDDGLDIASPALAHAMFCCAQEAISNAVRHAGATTLTIEIARHGDELMMLAADDGHGSRNASEGNGLRGMRERLALLDGRLQAGDRQPRGYAIHITLPIPGGVQ
jgi:signal transduction histidine kinase